MRIRAVWVVLVLAPVVCAQNNPALDWAMTLRGRYQLFKEPVVSVYATANLGALVCTADHSAGAGLYQDALRGLSLLTPQQFLDSKHVLPSASFTALWKSVTGGAAKCDASLEQFFDGERARAKMETERQNANRTLRLGRSLIEDSPDRAGQLAEAAIGVSTAGYLDISFLVTLLAQLRERAPEVADDVFPAALDMIASPQAPNPSLLMELGKFLFVSSRLFETPDKESNNDVVTVSGAWIANFREVRQSTIPDEVRDYIEAVLKVLTTNNTANFDPVVGYALAYQLLPKASDMAPDTTDRLQQVLVQLQALASSAATEVQSQLAVGANGARSESDAAARAHTIAAVWHAVGQGHFAEARELGKGNSDLVSRSQIASLIDFAESGAAASHKDIAWASTLADSLVPGIKRSLLYAGIAAASGSRDVALGPFQLALRDIRPLPAEQRMFTLAGNAGAIFGAAPDNGLLALGLMIDACNDAYVSPHKGFFDPQVLRRPSPKGSISTDSSLILFNRRGLLEVVDTGQHRYNFTLRVPGVEALRLPAVLPLARGVDPARLEALILGLKDEAQMAEALNALVAVRLKN